MNAITATTGQRAGNAARTRQRLLAALTPNPPHTAARLAALTTGLRGTGTAISFPHGFVTALTGGTP